MQHSNLLKSASFLLASCLFLFACKKSAIHHHFDGGFLGSHNHGPDFYALTNSNQLINYSSGRTIKENSMMAITGLAIDEKMLAIDFRPATGQLYGVSNMSILYTINLNTGLASSAGPKPPAIPAFTPAISGTQVGFDFNPTVDRIRLVTNTGQNLRLNPETGLVVFTDGSITPVAANVTAVAYTNSFASAATTTLYDIDVASDKLFIQNPPNDGTLVEVGKLGVNAFGEAGFDISADGSVAIAAFYGKANDKGKNDKSNSNSNKYRFYYIDLETGDAELAGNTNREIIGLAIPTMPVAYAVDNMNQLLIMNPVSGTVVPKLITGLTAGDQIVGIDMRPATGQLYALGMSSRLYSINMSNGAAAAKGAMAFNPALSGTSFAFDFNPTVDRIRIISNTGQNLRAHPDLGTIPFTDAPLNPGMPMVDAAAYTNTFIGTTMTTLYDIDYGTDMIYVQNPPNAGTLINGMHLGINVEAGNGFDIGGTSNKAWGIFTVGGQSGLYSINLGTGMANYSMAAPANIKGFAIGLGF